MTATILILTCLAMMHFIYESIILPSIRLSLRFKLFALRDQLRSMVMQGTASNEVFRIQQSSINNAINMLSWADQAMISRFERQLRDDEAMRKRVEKRVKIVEDYDSEEFQRVVRETSAVFQNAVIANMGAWFFMEPRLRALLNREITYAGREAAASPAPGSAHVFQVEQEAVISSGLGIAARKITAHKVGSAH